MNYLTLLIYIHFICLYTAITMDGTLLKNLSHPPNERLNLLHVLFTPDVSQDRLESLKFFSIQLQIYFHLNGKVVE